MLPDDGIVVVRSGAGRTRGGRNLRYVCVRQIGS